MVCYQPCWDAVFCGETGRYLYKLGRGEVDNAITTNGERYVQHCVMNRPDMTGRITVLTSAPILVPGADH